MRQERTVQASIFDLFAEHEIGRELKAMSQWLDEHRELIGLAEEDLAEGWKLIRDHYDTAPHGQVEVAAAPDDAREIFAQDRLRGGEDHGLDAIIHSRQRAGAGRSSSSVSSSPAGFLPRPIVQSP